MLQPKVFFAFVMMVLGTFLIRPVFAAEVSSGDAVTMLASCTVRPLSGGESESQSDFAVRVESFQSAVPDGRYRKNLVSMKEDGLFGWESGREHLLDLRVYADSASGKRIYRATVYKTTGSTISHVGNTMRGLSSSEFISADSQVQMRHFDYSIRKMFDCSLSEVSDALLSTVGEPNSR